MWCMPIFWFTLGLCSCFDGYIGVDCSQDISQPPLNISLPADGLCGTRSRACRRTNIYGTFLTKDVWCKKRHFQLINDTRIYTAKPVVIKADYRNTFMVSVDLEGSHRKRSVDAFVVEGYDLSLSNDGERFGENISIIIYDEDCFNCNSSSSICVLLDTCPLYATSTALVTTSEVITTQPDTTKMQSTTTTEKETTKQSTGNTVSTPVHDPITTLMTTTEQETTQQTTTAKVSTTKEKQTTSQTTTSKPTIEQLTSYMGPIVLGASIVILLVIVAIVCVCLKFKRGKQSPRFQDEQTRNITQFNSWNIYKGSSSIVSKDMQAEKQWNIYNGNSNGDNDDKHRNLIPPEFRFAARMNSTATSMHQIRLPPEKNQKSFFDYYLQK